MLIMLTDVILYFYYRLFESSLDHSLFPMKIDSDFLDSFIGPIYHEHRDSTVQFIHLYFNIILPVLNALQWKHGN